MSLPSYADTSRALGTFRRRNVTILGYGAVGAAYARCLRDSGVDLRIGLEPGHPDIPLAEAEGFLVLPQYDACEEADLVCLLEPPERQEEVFEAALAENLVRGDALIVSDGFGLRYGLLEVPDGVDVALVTPMGPPSLVRREYAEGRGVPMLVALAADESGDCWDLALGFAAALGGTRAGIVTTTVAEAVDSRGLGLAVAHAQIPRVMRAAYDELVGAGYSPEAAYLACVHEAKAAVDAIHSAGIDGMRAGLEPWAATVAATADHADAPEILEKLTDATLARQFLVSANAPAAPPSESDEVGAKLRGLMPWLRPVDEDAGERWR